MKKVNSIDCIISDGLSIRLENVVETYGHDDSLPFNADVFVYDANEETGCFHKIATAYNDGWGGDSVITATQTRYEKQLKEIDNYLRENFEVVTILPSSGTKIEWDVTLEYIVTEMAYYAIDLGVNKIELLALKDIKQKNNEKENK